MPQYRKKPVVIEARRFVGDAQALYDVYRWIELHAGSYSRSAIDEFPAKGVSIDRLTGDLIIMTLEGEMRCQYGDWVIRGTQGEFYPCKNLIFESIYEPAELPENELAEMIEKTREMNDKVYEKPMSQYEEMVNAIALIEKQKKRPE